LDHFQKALIKPVSSAVLNNTLLPALPTALSNVPPFLKLCEQAVKFETDIIEGILAVSRSQDSDIRQWVADIPGHVERKRRMEILDGARGIIMRLAVDGATEQTFRAEKPVDNVGTALNEVIPEIGSAPVQETSFPQSNGSQDRFKMGVGLGIAQVNEDDKGSVINEEEMGEIPDEADEDAWGLGDDEGGPEEDAPEAKSAVNSNGHSLDLSKIRPTNGYVTTTPAASSGAKADDSADAWGFDDEDEAEAEEPQPEEKTNGNTGEEEVGWDDDPWGEAEGNANPNASSTTAQAKVHTNGHSNGYHNGDARTNIHPSSKLTEKKPTGLHVNPVPVETYSVSNRAHEIATLVKGTLDEGRALADSRLFVQFLSSISFPLVNGPQSSFTQGSLLTASASSILDLYRALYPVAFMQTLQGSSSKAMQFSNDCAYLHSEISKLNPISSNDASWERFTDSTERLKVLGESWYIDTVVSRFVLASNFQFLN
jgi:protein transport protein DSL1/ZW10